MPNNGRVTKCPYYRDEKNLSISCEDTFRRFRWPAQKKRHMDTFCDKDWKLCPYAQDLNRLYEQMGGEMSDVAKMAQELKAKDKELRKVSVMLGKASKREAEKDEKIRQLQRERNALESMYMRTRQQIAEYSETEKRLYDQICSMSALYEARFAFLMDKIGGRLDEEELREWVKKYEFSIQPAEVQEDLEDGRDVVAVWEVIKREVKEEKKDGEV